MFKIAPEQDEDWWEVEALYDLCFAPGRSALSSYRLREDVPTVAGLSCVVRDEYNVIAGAIRYWPVCIGDKKALLLGPIAVHPTYQGEGLGGLLIRETLANARAFGWVRVLLVGDAPYYRRFGFEKNDQVEMPPPTNPDRVLSLALTDGAWDHIKGEVRKYSSDCDEG